MGEKGQGAASKNTVRVPLQQGGVQSDSDWNSGGPGGNTVGVPLQQGEVQSDNDWNSGGPGGNTVGVPLQQGGVQSDNDWNSGGGKGGSANSWWLIGVLICALIVVGATMTLIGGGRPNERVTPIPTSGLQGNAALGQASVTPVCALSLISPAEADQIPETGALKVEWSSVPGAASYALKVIPPPSFSSPWLFPAKGTTRTIYMENFTAGGDYQFSVQALDPSGGVLCETELKFTRAALVAPSARKHQGDGCTTTGMLVICP